MRVGSSEDSGSIYCYCYHGFLSLLAILTDEGIPSKIQVEFHNLNLRYFLIIYSFFLIL